MIQTCSKYVSQHHAFMIAEVVSVFFNVCSCIFLLFHLLDSPSNLEVTNFAVSEQLINDQETKRRRNKGEFQKLVEGVSEDAILNKIFVADRGAFNIHPIPPIQNQMMKARHRLLITAILSGPYYF